MMKQEKSAKIVRLVTPDHLCPWGIKAIDLLRRHGYEIEDEHLESSEANRRYKEENGVDETPQIWIAGERVGGYDELREHLGLGPDPREGESYQPVLVIFAVTFLLALATVWAQQATLAPVRVAELFIAFSMAVLGLLKLQDLQRFSTGFVQYDLLARRYVPYAYFYPFVEAGAGILMVGGLLTYLAAPLALIVSSIGALSVFKAVYLEKRDLNCACVGGGSRVPLGFLSLTENLLMMAMSIWMILKASGLVVL
ncbi:MAG: glutaredoxin family protein [Verrucomicrobiales bacterium]